MGLILPSRSPAAVSTVPGAFQNFRSLLTAVQEVGMCCPGFIAEEMGSEQPSDLSRVAQLALNSHFCDSEAQMYFWDALPLRSPPEFLRKWGKWTDRGRMLASWALTWRGWTACGLGQRTGSFGLRCPLGGPFSPSMLGILAEQQMLQVRRSVSHLVSLLLSSETQLRLS